MTIEIKELIIPITIPTIAPAGNKLSEMFVTITIEHISNIKM